MNTNTVYYNAVQAQAQSIRNKNITPGHYVQKQRDGQIVRVVSKDTNLTLSLPGLAPYFQGMNSSLGTNSDDMYYQIKSFRCTNRFYNVLPGDRVVIMPTITVRNIEGLDNVGGVQQQITNIENAAGHGFNIILNTTEKAQVMSAQQIVDQLNFDINKLIMQMEMLGNMNLLLTQQIALAFLFDRAYFAIRDSRLVLAYTIDAGAVGEPGQVMFSGAVGAPNYPVLNNGTDYYVITSIQLTLATYPYANAQDAYRVASLFGLSNESIDPITGNKVYGTTYNFDSELLEAYTLANAHRRVPANGLILPRTIINVPTELYAIEVGEPIFVYPFTSIYIHSSLQSNIWDELGRKNDVIAVIPLQGDQDVLAIEYQPPASAERTYNIRDSLASLQSFTMRFTDQNNNDIVFHEEYELELAIFFTPKDPIVTSM